jgi:hypothetical protein
VGRQWGSCCRTSPCLRRSRSVGERGIRRLLSKVALWTGQTTQQQAADGPGRGAATQEVLVVAETNAIADAGAELVAFQLPVLDSVANSGQGRQQPAARRAQPLRRLALASPGVHTTGSGSIAFLVRRARGHCRSALTLEHGAPRGSPSWATTTEAPGGRQRPELDQAPVGVPRRGVVTDLPVAHRDDHDATGGLARWHLARAADAGGERRVLATTLALGIAAAAHSCEIVEGTEASRWW